MNKLIKVRVADILLRHPSTKDNDRELIVRYWKQEVADMQDIAREKLQSAIDGNPDHIIISADTILACGRRIIQKAKTAEEERSILKILSGRRHRVLTSIAVYNPEYASHKEKIRTRYSDTHVSFKRLSESEISDYISSNQWQDCCGYGGHGLALTFVKSINGNYS